MNIRKPAQCADREDSLRAQDDRTGMRAIEALKIDRKLQDKTQVIDSLTKEKRQVHPALPGNG